MNKRAILFVFTLFLLAAVSGCAAPAPVTMDSMPIPSGAQATTNALYVQLQNNVLEGLQNAEGVKIDNLQGRVYTTAKDAQWTDIEKFYDGELTRGNWKTEPKMSASNTSVHGKGWLRGQQVFAVFFISDPNVPDALLLTALGNVKQ